MKRFYILWFGFASAGLSAVAQDVHLTQYFNAPLLINPALTGNSNYDYRFGLNYRQQWSSVTIPYRTFDLYGDFSINNDNQHYSYMSFGGFLLGDRAGDGNYTVLKAAFSGAYHIFFNDQSTTHLAIGLQVAYVQKQVDFTKLYFDDQWNDLQFDPSLPSGENFSSDHTSYPDFAAGAVFDHRFSNSVDVYVGGAAFHLTQPTESFYANPDNHLGIRPAINAGANLQINSQFAVFPSVFYMTEKGAEERMGGVMLGYALNDYSSTTTLYGGVFMRMQDAISPVFGLEFAHWRATVSYDVNISTLSAFSGGRGGMEVSIMYLGSYSKGKSKTAIPCPRF